MADQGTAGGMAGAHEAGPVTDGMPVEVATVKAPKGQVVGGVKPAGIGCSRKGAH